MGIISNLFGPKVDLSEVIADGAIVLDVRTKGEYASGHVKGSKHIPLDQVGSRMEEIKSWNKPVVAVCASGGRSGAATNAMKSAGIEAYNGGPWTVVDAIVR